MSLDKEKTRNIDFLSELDQLRALLLLEKIKSAKTIDELMKFNNSLHRLMGKSQVNREEYNRKKRIKNYAESLKSLSREEILNKYSPKK